MHSNEPSRCTEQLQTNVASTHRIPALALSVSTAVELPLGSSAIWTRPMATHPDAPGRRWLMLQSIPRHPRKITALDLAAEYVAVEGCWDLVFLRKSRTAEYPERVEGG